MKIWRYAKGYGGEFKWVEVYESVRKCANWMRNGFGDFRKKEGKRKMKSQRVRFNWKARMVIELGMWIEG